MNATAAWPVVGVDLAKNVFQLAVADAQWRVVEQHRLTRAQFERWFANRAVRLVVMEACGSAHHWARWLQRPRASRCGCCRRSYVRAYVKRNKTDAADAARLARGRALRRHLPVRIKVDRAAGAAGTAPHALAVDGHAHLAHQRAARLLPRVRHCHRAGRAHRHRADRARRWPMRIRRCPRCCAAPMPLAARGDPRCWRRASRSSSASSPRWRAQSPPARRCSSIPGIGLLTATAMVAATSGEVAHFAAPGTSPPGSASRRRSIPPAPARRLGRISKRGDRYLRMLLTHGARSVLRAATAARQRGQDRSIGLRAGHSQLQQRTNHNKATCALANKLARICYAAARSHSPTANPCSAQQETAARCSFAIAA